MKRYDVKGWDGDCIEQEDEHGKWVSADVALVLQGSADDAWHFLEKGEVEKAKACLRAGRKFSDEH